MEKTEIVKNYKGFATYQITVQGKVDSKNMSLFNNFVVIHSETKDNIFSTLTGRIKDQEALSGILNILFDHQYPVISVIKID